MDELGSLWDYHENINELREKLLYTIAELDSLKVQSNEETRKHKIYVEQLTELLKIAYQERDEARNQLQNLLNKLMPASLTDLQKHPVLLQAQPESPLVRTAKANSSRTESNSLSDTYNHHSHGSSTVDSFFDAVSSPDFSGINMADSSHLGFSNKPFVREYNGSSSAGLVSPVVAKVDPADAVIDNLVKGKVLPPKGKLLSAVMEAGPLLKTLLVAGPLPQWRNPPPVQPLKIPPVAIKGCEATSTTKQKPAASTSCVAQMLMTSQPHLDLFRGSSKMCSTSLLNFDRSPACSGLGNVIPINCGVIGQLPPGKRQRFQ